MTKDFDFKLQIGSVTEVKLVKMEDNVLKIGGNWGNITYQDLNHTIYELHIKSPSDHKV